MLTEKNPSSRLWRVVLLLVLCVAGAAGLQTAAWVGFIGSDDMEYYLAGRALEGELKRFLRDRSWAVRPPRRAQELNLIVLRFLVNSWFLVI